VSQPVRGQRAQTGPPSGDDHRMSDPTRSQAAVRGLDPNEYAPFDGALRAGVAQVVRDRRPTSAGSGSRSLRGPLPTTTYPHRQWCGSISTAASNCRSVSPNPANRHSVTGQQHAAQNC
jgi:hypothetical protein